MLQDNPGRQNSEKNVKDCSESGSIYTATLLSESNMVILYARGEGWQAGERRKV